MSFLTPLYLLGALAVALPVVFHMIRRTPSGRQEFSSVMFLEPTPPRITNRSHIEHWLLLLLRAAAVCLLAIAFARPFLRLQGGTAVVSADFREVVVLLDTSASMNREGLWDEVLEQVIQAIEMTEPRDRVEVMTFDRAPRVLIDSVQWTGLSPSQRVSLVKKRLSDLSPSWASTDLGRGLIEAAERLDDEQEIEGLGQMRRIVVVSDLQQGARIESLQAYQWPKHLGVELVTVGEDVSPSNAGLHLMQTVSAEENAANSDARVRVTNAEKSTREHFSLRWATDDSTQTDVVAQSIAVPPGKSRVVSLVAPSESVNSPRLLLEGDDHPFDNVCHVGSFAKRTVHVLLISGNESHDPESMRYYLERALINTSEREITLDVLGPADESEISEDIDLLTVIDRPNEAMTAQLHKRIRGGTTALVVPSDAVQMSVLFELLRVVPQDTSDAGIDDYVMLNEIDFTHPMFAALDQPRFSDFTEVRFWKHRSLNTESLSELRVLARFDDGDIAIGEIPIGEGKIVFFTAGWHPADSQLALSTKFVPMINGLLDDAAGIVNRPSSYVVGDTVDLTEMVTPPHSVSAVITPPGEQINITSEDATFTATDQPGRYRVLLDGSDNTQSPEFVVNLDPSESDTSVLPVDTLRAAGVPLDVSDTSPAASKELQRQLHNSELEKQQKLWRWIIIAAILVLFVETILASRLSRAHTP